VLLLGLSGSPAASQAQNITFQQIGTKRLWITEYSQFFNLSDDLLVFENIGNKRDGLFAHAYDIAQASLAKDKIKRRGVHHGITYMQVLPDIVGTRMAYIGFRHDTSGWDVYVYDYGAKLEQRITNSPTVRKDAVAISNNSVAWVELSIPGYYFSIYLYDLDTETTRLVTTTPARPSSLAVDGNWITWQDARHDAWGTGLDTDVFLFDLERNREQRISTGPPLTTANSPSLSGDFLVWADGQNNPDGNQGKTNIFLRNLVSGQQWQLTNGENETNCHISGERIVYQDLGAHRTYDWILFNLSSEDEIGLLPKNSQALEMRISNRHVAYVDPGSPGVRGAFYLATLPE
jgi:Tol biopolymer transport system component